MRERDLTVKKRDSSYVMSVTRRNTGHIAQSEPDNNDCKADLEQQHIPHLWPSLEEKLKVDGQRDRKGRKQPLTSSLDEEAH